MHHLWLKMIMVCLYLLLLRREIIVYSLGAFGAPAPPFHPDDEDEESQIGDRSQLEDSNG